MVQDTVDVLPADTLPAREVGHGHATDPPQRPQPCVNELGLIDETAPPERCWVQPQRFRGTDGSMALIYAVPKGQDREHIATVDAGDDPETVDARG